MIFGPCLISACSATTHKTVVVTPSPLQACSRRSLSHRLNVTGTLVGSLRLAHAFNDHVHQCRPRAPRPLLLQFSPLPRRHWRLVVLHLSTGTGTRRSSVTSHNHFQMPCTALRCAARLHQPRTLDVTLNAAHRGGILPEAFGHILRLERSTQG